MRKIVICVISCVGFERFFISQCLCPDFLADHNYSEASSHTFKDLPMIFDACFFLFFIGSLDALLLLEGDLSS